MRSRRRPASFGALAGALASLLVATAMMQRSSSAEAVPVAAAHERAVAGFVPISPRRVYETRDGQPGHRDGSHRLAAGATVNVDLSGALPDSVTEVAGVWLNVTVVDTTAAGFVTVWPSGARPLTSMLNFSPHTAVAGGTFVGVDPSGAVLVHNGSTGSLDLVIDLTGWVPMGAGFTAMTPRRVLDTRVSGRAGVVGGTAPHRIEVASFLAAPAGVVTAVAVNVTVVDPGAAGYLAIFPSGGPTPPTSSVNFAARQTVANAAVVGVDASGALDVVSSIDALDVVMDVTGYFVDGRVFRGMAPKRVVDTRASSPLSSLSPFGAGHVETIKIDAAAGLPRGLVGAVAVNVTAVSAAAAGYLTLWPASSPRPIASSLNVAPGRTVANTVVVGVDENGEISIFTSSGSTDVVVDITGWFPQDPLGVVADGRQLRRYSQGDDHLAVVFCQPTDGSPRFAAAEEAAALDLLRDAGDYFQWLSGGRYTQSFSVLGDASATYLSPGQPDCAVPPVPFGTTGVVKVVPPGSHGAYGVTDPGQGCREVSCGRGREYPSNRRQSLISMDALASLTAPGSVAFSVAVHELGHLLDWPHSYWGVPRSSCPSGRRDTVCEYDNPLDVMSREPAPGAHAVPQATIAFNRYAAGWIDPSVVARHDGGTTTYAVTAIGGASAAAGERELVVVPTAGGSALLTIEVRATAVAWDVTLARYDGQLQREGVVVHRIDQRADVACADVVYFDADHCSGGERRQQPALDTGSYLAPTYVNVLGPGSAPLVVDGVTITVLSGGAGRYRVQVSGTPSFAPIRAAAATAGAAALTADRPR